MLGDNSYRINNNLLEVACTCRHPRRGICIRRESHTHVARDDDVPGLACKLLHGVPLMPADPDCAKRDSALSFYKGHGLCAAPCLCTLHGDAHREKFDHIGSMLVASTAWQTLCKARVAT